VLAVEPAMAPVPLVKQQSNNPNMERPVARAVVTGTDRVLPANRRVSIQGEVRANDLFGCARC
jgi:hypothetical protein